jgi:hypothetical protein
VPAADGAFVPLAQVLWPPATDDVVPVVLPAPVSAPAPEPHAAGSDDVARDVRVFRARLAEAFDVARAGLLRELAYAVLGRELLLADADVAAIAARILAEHAGARPVRLRVAPSELAALAARVPELPPLESDADLAPGDAIVEFAGGDVDARLGIRLATVLDGRT